MTRSYLYIRKCVAFSQLVSIWRQPMSNLSKLSHLPFPISSQLALNVIQLELKASSFNHLLSTIKVWKVIYVKNRLNRCILTCFITRSAISLLTKNKRLTLLKDISWPEQKESKSHIESIFKDLLSDIHNISISLTYFLQYYYTHALTSTI